MALELKPNLADADGTYAMLLKAHADLSARESATFNAALILILCNHIGDRAVIDEALAAARGSMRDLEVPATTARARRNRGDLQTLPPEPAVGGADGEG